MLGDGLEVLWAEAASLKPSASATTTQKTYKSQTKCYLKICNDFGLIPIPATQDTILTYMAFLARTLSSRSIPSYMNVIRILNIEAGFINPLEDNWKAKMVQKGISHTLGSPVTQKLAISIDKFGQRVHILSYTSCPDARLCPVWALLVRLGTSKLPALSPLFKFVMDGKEILMSHSLFMSRTTHLKSVATVFVTEVPLWSFKLA